MGPQARVERLVLNGQMNLQLSGEAAHLAPHLIAIVVGPEASCKLQDSFRGVYQVNVLLTISVCVCHPGVSLENHDGWELASGHENNIDFAQNLKTQ
jgi:hypothetical protein